MTPRPRLAGRRHRNGGRRRQGRHRGRRGRFSGRLMRQVFQPGLVPVLPLAVGTLPGWRCLVLRARRLHRLPPCHGAARRAAVPVTPVAVGAEEEHLPARGPAARHEAQALFHRTRRAPASGDMPRPGVRLALPRASHAHRHAAPDGLLSGCWGALRLPGRAFRPSGVLLHSHPTSFQSPPDPLELLGPVTMLDTTALPVRATTTTTMVIDAAINPTSIRFHADLADRPQIGPGEPWGPAGP